MQNLSSRLGLFQESALVIPSFFFLGPLSEYGLIHQGVEVWVNLGSEQGLEHHIQAPPEHVMFLVIPVHFFRGIAG